MGYSQNDMLSQNVNSFPNNNSGQITPADLRDFNANLINSVQFTDVPTPNAVSASFATVAGSANSASFATTASNTPNAFVSANQTGGTNTVTLVKGNGQTTTATINNVASASYALIAQQVIEGSVSASYAATASWAAYSVTASHALNVPATASYALNAESASYATTASFALNVPATASFAISSSFAITASYAANANIDTGSLLLTSSFNAYTSSTNAFTASIKTFTGSIQTQVNALQAATSSYATKTELNAYTGSTNAFTASMKTFTGSVATTYATKAEVNAFTGSTNTFTSSIQTQVNALQAATSSYVTNAQTASMSVLSASFASTAGVALTVQNGLNISASNITVANNLVVNGTASFAYTKTTTGSAVVIGDEFIILNADTPTAPFAGIMVYDTGSNSTASFEWNGNSDYWITVEESGASAGILTGASGSKGSEVFPSLNRLTKGTGNNTIIDSNITDNGSIVSINSNTQITGSLSTTGDINVAQGSNVVTHHVKAAAVNGIEIQNNTGGVVGLFGAGGSLGTTFYGQVNATAFSGSGALVTGVISSSYASNAGAAGSSTSASYALTASFANNATTASYVNTLNQPVIISGSLNVSSSYSGSNVILNQTDTFSQPKVHQIVTCTQAEYNTVSGSAQALNTLYIITDQTDTFATSASFASTASYWSGSIINALSSSYADNASTASYVASTGTATSASYAATASFVNPLVQDLLVTGSVEVSPRSMDTTSYAYTIIEASDATATGGNLIIARNTTTAASTGSINISGSNLIALLSDGAVNANISAGSGSGFRGRNSIVTAAPNVGGTNGTGYAREVPTYVNSVINTAPAVVDNRPSGTGTPLTLSSVSANSGLTVITSTGSITYGNSNIAGLQNYMNVTGSNGTTKSITSLNIFGNANSASIDSPSAGGSFTGVLVAGNTNGVYVSGSLTTLQAAALLGYGLQLTGSANSTTNFGSVAVGRFNNSGSLSANTAFEVGTGTSATARRTSLHVSSSGLTTISNLSATGNLSGTASFATSASYALTASYASNVPETASYAVSASYADNAGVAQTAISASYALTASFVPGAIYNASASADNTVTFTRGDGSTFSVYIPLSGSTAPTTSTTTTTTTAGFVAATGGTVTTDGDYKIHTFTTSADFVVTSVGNGFVEVLSIGGGGSSGNGADGGGGAGGYFYTSSLAITATTYAIGVGAGAARRTSGSNFYGGYKGGDTTFGALFTTLGGCGGSAYEASGQAGGASAGGGSAYNTYGPTTSSPDAYSTGSAGGTGVSSQPRGGGGGGSYNAGLDGGDSNAKGGPGGDGLANPIVGSTSGQNVGGTYYFAGGGGGCSNDAPTSGGGNQGWNQGGRGGGGRGGYDGGAGSAGDLYTTSGTANTGGGAGGSRNGPGSTAIEGRDGGSGILIVRYKYQ